MKGSAAQKIFILNRIFGAVSSVHEFEVGKTLASVHCMFWHGNTNTEAHTKITCRWC